MRKYFCKKAFGIVGLSMAVIIGCTACAGGQSDIPYADGNKSVNSEKQAGDMQETDKNENLPGTDQSDSGFYDGADLQGSVVEFSDDGFSMSVAEIIKEDDGGEVMVEAAPGAEQKEDLVTITYASDVTFEVITIDKASLTELSREETEKESIKKQTSVLVFGSCQDTYHWTADKVMILRWK